MSELLRNLAAWIRESHDPEVHVVTGLDLAGDEPSVLAPAQPTTAQADLEGRSLDAVPVGDPRPGRFSCFMDGMERQRVALYYGIAPVIYGYTAAVIRERWADKRMRTHGAGPTVREALFYPRRLVDLPLSDIDAVDTDDEEKRLEEHPMIMLEAAKKKVSNTRNALERRITSDWLSAADSNGSDWLLVDGSLAGDYGRYSEPNILGVVKSHQTQYFPMEQQRKVLGLRVGERSGVFIPKGRRRPDVYSWYLRLRPNDGQDVYFGLVRVEAAKCERTLAMADELSRWLLAERTPLSLPDSRWDRMIYPIRDCEQYLKSLAPSRVMLDAALMQKTMYHERPEGNGP